MRQTSPNHAVQPAVFILSTALSLAPVQISCMQGQGPTEISRTPPASPEVSTDTQATVLVPVTSDCPSLAIEPAELSIEGAAGRPVEAVLHITNDCHGTTDLLIYDLALHGSDSTISLASPPQLPLALSPGSQADIRIILKARARHISEAALSVLADDPERPAVMVPVYGAIPFAAPTKSEPVADAGPYQTISLGEEATVDGSSSYDPDGDFLLFHWTLERIPEASGLSHLHAISPDDEPVAYFTPDVEGDYRPRLRVFDGSSWSTDATTVAAVDSNEPPVALLSTGSAVPLAAEVTLDASDCYDPEGAELQYQWFLKPPPGSTTVLDSSTEPTSTLTPDIEGLYLVLLAVGDGVFTTTASTRYLAYDEDLDDDGIINAEDCDPEDPATGGASTWYLDADDDGYGDQYSSSESCDAPSGYVADSSDCDDGNAEINPGMDDDCLDGLDNDCDDAIDEGATWYLDVDDDGWGDPESWTESCDAPSGYVADSSDCDDGNAEINPSADELCDELDNDCDGEIDEAGAIDEYNWYPDGDGDGYGDPDSTTTSCHQPSGYVDNASDCDDSNASVHPGVDDDCSDGVDNDCDAYVDEGSTWYADTDGDGYGDPGVTETSCDQPSGYVLDSSDCDDLDASVHPGDGDDCYDDVDNDCDGEIDEGTTWYLDGDGDGWGLESSSSMECGEPSGYALLPGDCDDTDPAINPGAEELCTGLRGDKDLSEADAKLYGVASHEEAGSSLASAGDTNADGFDDLIVGAVGNDLGGIEAGAVYLLNGPLTGAFSLDLANATLLGESPYDHLGHGVSSAGDMNADGYADLLLGAPDEDWGGTAAGAAYVVLGPVSGETDLAGAHAKLVGEAALDLLGSSLAAAGDVNSDGYDDILLGAYLHDSDSCNVGAAYLVLGPVTGELDLSGADARMLGQHALDGLGFAVSTAGDMNADGYADLLLGAPDEDYGGPHAGAAYVLSGPLTGEVDLLEATAKLIGESSGDHAGYSVSTAGDKNDDGFDDIIVGAPGQDSAATDAGAAYLLLGPISGRVDLSESRAMLLGEYAGDQAGSSVSTAGDVNADGRADILVGAPWGGEAGSDTGMGYLLFGLLEGEIPLADADARFLGETYGDMLGTSVSSAGDLDGDGYDDLLFGASHDDEGGIDAGAAYLVLGSAFRQADEDCDGDVDEGRTWYEDADGDGYGNDETFYESCAELSGYVPSDGDCDDSDPDTNPDADEYCDDIDNDCDGEIDESDSMDSTTWYADADGDGHGDPDDYTPACDAPSGYVSDDSDCDDTNPDVNPDADEYCDDIDNDCDGEIDEDPLDGSTWYADTDGDGYGDPDDSEITCSTPTGRVEDNSDCDDSSASVHPGADEYCNDLDDDCDGEVDEDSLDESSWYSDADGDGYGDPDAPTTACDAPAGTVSDSTDCDDTEAAVHPGVTDDCDDSVDNDCDGEVDEGGTWYLDSDGDGFGSDDTTEIACDAPSGYVASSGDCDPGDPDVYPGAIEYCNGMDDDCDGTTDEGDSADAATWYQDADGDGYGDPGSALISCNMPSGYVADSTDCDDSDAGINPSASEVCNSVWGEFDLSSASAKILGETKDDYLGESLSAAGDVNADGYDDIIMGATGNDANGDCSGTSYLFLGPISGEMEATAADALLMGEADYDYAGASVSGAGDVNADGYDDIIIGAYKEDSAAPDSGAAYLVLGPLEGEQVLSDATAKMQAEYAYDFAGWSVSSAGDIDGDGYDDILVGAYGNDSAGSMSGAAYLVLGPMSGEFSLSEADVKLEGENSYDMSSYYLAGGGDLNGDGHPDLLIGAQGNDSAAEDAGAVYVQLGPMSADASLSSAHARIQGESAFDYAGNQLSWAGDVNADGYDDILVAAHLEDSAGENAGAAYLVLGPLSAGGDISLSQADAKLLGEAAGDSAGRAVASAGDVNVDGFDDILVGANGHDGVNADMGSAYLLLGPVTGQLHLRDAQVKMRGEASDDNTGAALAWAGDMDADGYGDFIISAFFESSNANEAGAVYLMLGSLLMDDSDEDCDGSTDDATDASTWYRDSDGDAWGTEEFALVSCIRPNGWVSDPSDCDDDDPTLNPDQDEVCDGLDNDCNGVTDDSSEAPYWFLDSDGDGFGDADYDIRSCDEPSGYVADPTDCDDSIAYTYPGADEYCDGIDNDCDDLVDESSSLDASTWFFDADGDGFGDILNWTRACYAPDGYVESSADCDDSDETVNPSVAELCGDGIDNDCDGEADPELIWYQDADGDGYGDESSSLATCEQPSGYVDDPDDCDDDDPDIHPGAGDDCYDLTDNDCDGETDEGDDWYQDADGDGYGDADIPVSSCDTPEDHVADSSDCDDSDGATHPLADEYCDGIDNDCDGVVDEDDAVDPITWYQDADGDGYGDAASTALACQQPDGYVEDSTDCDDSDTDINPAAVEICSLLQQDINVSATGISFTDERSSAWNEYAVSTAGDTDNDGYEDLVIGSDSAGIDDQGAFILFLGPITDAQSLSDAHAFILGETEDDHLGASVAWAGDTNADGHADLLLGAWGEDESGSMAGAAYLLTGPISADATLAGAGFKLVGETAGDAAGYEVAAAGDVNGDGRDDFLVGARYEDSGGGLAAGATYLVTGPVSADMDLSGARAKLLGEERYDYSGSALSSAGDLNDDGFQDLLIGAYGNDSADAGAGAVYVVYGPVTGELDLSTADARLLGESSGDAAGFSLASAGDMDADGHDDIVIGAYGEDSAGTNAGAVYVVLGPVSGESSLEAAEAKLTGENASDYAGWDLAAGGDANDDGYDDMIVGAPGLDSGETRVGAAYLVLAPVTGVSSLADAPARYTGDQESVYAGYSLSFVGDQNADGRDDFLMGYYSTSDGSFAAAHLLPGNEFYASDEDCDGEIDEDDASNALTWFADLDGDGYGDPDSSTSACYQPSGYVSDSTDCDDLEENTHPGAVEICGDFVDDDCDGRTVWDCDGSVATATLLGEANDDYAGANVSPAGDVNGDGIPDILIGAYGESTTGEHAGAAYLLHGPVSGEVSLSDAAAKLTGEATYDWAGYCVAGDGDINADGFDDILVGAYRQDAAAENAGAVYLLTGPVTGESGLDGAHAILLGEVETDNAGYSVALVDDMNLDGYDELLIGAMREDSAADGAGCAYLVLGPVTGEISLSTANAKLLGEHESDSAGNAVTGIGDFDQDGYGDLLVGAYQNDAGGTKSGSAYVVFGPVTGEISLGDAEAKFYGEDTLHRAAISVASADDINNDGYPDILIGADSEDFDSSGAGSAYLVLGPVLGEHSLGEADAKLVGENEDDSAGYSVSSAGDVDGDGYADIVVGAPDYDGGFDDSGAVYLVMGPVSGRNYLSDSQSRITGECEYSATGYSVALLGDMDGDGLGDFLVGAPGDASTDTAAGAVYVLAGSLFY